MTSAGGFLLAIAVGLIIVGCLTVARGHGERQAALHVLDNARLQFWDRVQQREKASQAFGEVMLGAFAVLCGLGLAGLALSGLLL